MSDFSTDLAGADDKQQLIELQDSVGGGYASTEEFDHWFLAHPAGEVTVPVVRAPDGSLVGAVWILPMRVSVGEEELLIAQVANLHVHPAYRDTFAYLTLSRHLGRILRRSTALHFSLPSVRVFERQQDLDPAAVARVPWLARILDPQALARQWRRQGGAYAVAALALPALVRVSAPKRTTGLGQAVRVHQVKEFDERFDRFWASARSRRPVAMVRDRAFLQWRFGGLEQRSYQTFVAESEGGMLGYLVLRQDPETAVAYIMDVSIADSPHAAAAATALLGAAEDECRAHGATVVSTVLSGASPEVALLTDAGFSPNPLGRINRLETIWPAPLRCAVFAHDREAVPAAMGRLRHWYISLAHHEML